MAETFFSELPFSWTKQSGSWEPLAAFFLPLFDPGFSQGQARFVPGTNQATTMGLAQDKLGLSMGQTRGAPTGNRLTVDNFSFFAYNWSLFVYNFSLFTYNWSFFAYITVGKCMKLRALRDCKQRSLTVSKKAPTVSKKAKIQKKRCLWAFCLPDLKVHLTNEP